MFLNSVRRAITDVEVLVISKEQLNDSLTPCRELHLESYSTLCAVCAVAS